MTDLRAKQSKGSKWTGIDVRSAKIADISKLEILEPLSVKEQIIKSATEAGCMILRIDDVIASVNLQVGLQVAECLRVEWVNTKILVSLRALAVLA